MLTVSLRFKDWGGVKTSDRPPGYLGSLDFLESFENLRLDFLSEVGKPSLSGLMVSNGNLKEDIEGLCTRGLIPSCGLASCARLLYKIQVTNILGKEEFDPGLQIRCVFLFLK